VTHIAGDEFACLLSGLPAGRVQLSRLACKLFDAVSGPFKIGKLDLTLRPSIGIAVWPIHGATAGTLLKSAQVAMHYAQRHQTGYAFFDGDADVEAVYHGGASGSPGVPPQ
jgi:diguanylate cyclase